MKSDMKGNRFQYVYAVKKKRRRRRQALQKTNMENVSNNGIKYNAYVLAPMKSTFRGIEGFFVKKLNT